MNLRETMHLISDWPRVGYGIIYLHVFCLLAFKYFRNMLMMSRLWIKYCCNTERRWIFPDSSQMLQWCAVFVCVDSSSLWIYFDLTRRSLCLHHRLHAWFDWYPPPQKTPGALTTLSACCRKKPHYGKYSICLRIHSHISRAQISQQWLILKNGCELFFCHCTSGW